MSQKFAPLDVRQGLEKRLNGLKHVKNTPMLADKIQDKAQMESDITRLESTVSAITPPDKTGAEKDKLRMRLTALQEAITKGDSANGVPRMTSERENWEDGASAPGNLLRYETFWGNHTLDDKGAVVPCERGKGAKWEIKDLRRVIYKDEEADNPEVASLENIRPREHMEPLHDVPRRSYGFSPALKANYDQAFPDHEPTAVEEKIDAKAAKIARRKAASERMKARWEERRQAKAKEAADTGVSVA